ncbi:hypothetical protein [Micromonospora aurantiaca (nom. illeg.)]|uniref:hypothetical protein n=1 Tax=Micromonospora aurantiaca (nom. illeg.) TaxID=47850 RepID=UPI0033FFD2E5
MTIQEAHDDAGEGSSVGNRVATIIRFALRGIWIEPDALGSRYTWETDGYQVTLTLPRQPNDFLRDDEPEVEPVPAVTGAPVFSGSGSHPAAVVHLVEVRVAFNGHLWLADREHCLKEREQGAADTASSRREYESKAEQLWTRGRDAAERLTHAWLAHVRTIAEQPWLGITAEIPQQYGRSRLVDEATGVGFLAFGPKQSLTLRHGGLAFSIDQLKHARDLVLTGEPPAAEALLADARFLASGADTVDAQRAVLVAAIACEVKAKRVVVERAKPERRQGLGRVSDLDKVIDGFYQQAFGMSLRLENQALFVQAKRLSALRNKIAHEGTAVDRDECNQLVLAATQIFGWLDAIQPSP